MALQTSGKISITDILNEMEASQLINEGSLQDLEEDLLFLGVQNKCLDELASLWYNKTKKEKFNSTKHCLSNWYGERWITLNSLTISPSRYIFSAIGGFRTISVTSNSSWTVKIVSGVSYSSISKTSGFNNSTFKVTINSNNNSSSLRSGRIEVKSGNLIRYFNWTQSGSEIIFEDDFKKNADKLK